MAHAMVTALDAGDPEAARIAHDAIGRILWETSAHGAEASPRARMATTLNATMADALAAGDVDAARIAHEALGRLLGRSAGDGAAVIQLAGLRRPT